jgi:chemotaxis protein methyltransferase CheR
MQTTAGGNKSLCFFRRRPNGSGDRLSMSMRRHQVLLKTPQPHPLVRSLFERFRRLIREKSGISLIDGKEALLCGRIAKRIRALGLTGPEDYLDHVTGDSSGAELIHLLDAIATNVTSFFREPEHFVLLERLFREWRLEGQTRFRFWSCACSTGEEPYSMAMTLWQASESTELDVRILATDISTTALRTGIEGVYPHAKLGGLSTKQRRMFFVKMPNHLAGDVNYSVVRQLREMIVFRRLNLSEPPFPLSGPFDIVFCRNVLIYFDLAVRCRLVQEISRLLKPGGYLLIGHSESLMGLNAPFSCVAPSVHCKLAVDSESLDTTKG